MPINNWLAVGQSLSALRRRRRHRHGNIIFSMKRLKNAPSRDWVKVKWRESRPTLPRNCGLAVDLVEIFQVDSCSND